VVAAAVLIADQWGEIHHERCAADIAALSAAVRRGAETGWPRLTGGQENR
jgi:hypothetical protein